MGAAQDASVKLQVVVYESSRVVGNFTKEYKLGSYLQVPGFNRLIAVGSPGALWGGHVFVKNVSNDWSASNMEIKVTSRDPRIVIRQEWMKLPQIQPGSTADISFILSTKQRGNFDDHVFDVQIRNGEEKTIYNAAIKQPIKQN